MDPVLVVDDEKDNLEALQRLLRNQYTVTTANSPFEALRLVQQNDYHVIISDQRMPEMSGVEFLEKVKHVRPGASRILLTGYTDIDSVIGAINRGNIFRYIAKPWDPADLRQTLRSANEAFLMKREIEKKNEALTDSNTELQKALEELQHLDRAKARFLSLISHELNTPLTVLSAFASLLVERKGTLPPDLQKAADSIALASLRFSEIISEVLTYVKLESENHLHLGDYDLVKATHEIIKALDPDARKREISVSATGDPLSLRCDGEKMRVALTKLLNDALTRAPEGEGVRVCVEGKIGRIHYTVWRKGEKISNDAFKPLEPEGQELHHRRNLGLSLAICKLIIEGHGGELRLDSDDIRGTTIELVLPVRSFH